MDAQPDPSLTDPRLQFHSLSLGSCLPPGAEFGRSQLFSPVLPSTHPLPLPPPSTPNQSSTMGKSDKSSKKEKKEVAAAAPVVEKKEKKSKVCPFSLPPPWPSPPALLFET